LTDANVLVQDGLVSSRVNQKARTRTAIVRAVHDLAGSGAEITMPAVAKAALVSEATAYRYFPDLVTLLLEADQGTWADPADTLAPLADSSDPVERIGYAAEALMAGVLANESAVRAMIAGSISRPGVAARRPGHRFGLIDAALAPAAGRIDPAALAQLRRDLAVVISADALFTLTDLCGLAAADAIASAVHTARTLAEAAFRDVAGLACPYPSIATVHMERLPHLTQSPTDRVHHISPRLHRRWRSSAGTAW
jgi:AcrR family transcriptional regulator